MLDTTLPFPHQSDQQLADWQASEQESQLALEESRFTSIFCQSVLSHTNNDGRLSDFNCMKLCSQHGLLWSDAVKDLGDYANHGDTLLGWLGY